MTAWSRLRSWGRAIVGRRQFERGMRDEMQLHVELYQEDLQRSGVSEADARRQAVAAFGSIEARRDECRDARGLRLVDELRGDITYALRLLRRSPGFTAAALLSLGLGIGANTAIFTLVDTVLIKTVPVRDPKALFFVDNSGGKSGGNSGPPYPCFELLRDHNRFFSGMAAFDWDHLKVTIDGVAEQMRGQYVSGGYFDVLGIQAVHGRVLTPADDLESPSGGAAVISHRLWQRRFGSDPAILGKKIQVRAHWITIVGVTPPGFSGLQVGSPMDITVPIRLAGNDLRARESWWFSVVGRVKPDVPIDNARADLETLFDGYMTEIGWPRDRRGYFSGIALVPAGKGTTDLRRQFSEPLLIIMAIVAMVLLIGCANVANLLLARASARRSEMAIRLAIGASRARLIRQLLTEGCVLVSLGAVAGLAFAGWGVSFLLGMIFAGSFDGLPLNPEFDARVLAFTAATALLTALLFSVAPAMRATRVDAAKPAGDRTLTIAGFRGRLGQSLVMVQVMLAVTLLGGAALFVRTLHNLNEVPSGFRHDGVLSMQVEATVPGRTVRPKTPDEYRADHARLGAIWEDFIARVGGLPEVATAAVATMSPLTGRNRGVLVAFSGGAPGPERNRGININHVTAGFFETIGIPLTSGRSFTIRDRAGSQRVAILNETAARAFFGTVSPIGRKINFPKQRVEDEYEIVGIVGDVRYQNLRTPDERMAYIPIEQSIDPITNVMVMARGDKDVTRFAAPMREIVKDAIPGGFVTRIRTIDQRLEEALIRERLLSLLATFSGALALILASLGLYGVMSYAVLRRAREIGIRMAIGASRAAVVWMVVRATFAPVIGGAILGTLGATIASRWVESQLFGVAPGDPLALSAAILVLLAVAAAAAFVPARRASRIEPAVALRSE